MYLVSAFRLSSLLNKDSPIPSIVIYNPTRTLGVKEGIITSYTETVGINWNCPSIAGLK